MNELNQHKKSDSIKWIITFVALTLLLISVITLGANALDNDLGDPLTQTEIGEPKQNPVELTSEEGLTTLQVVNSDLMMLSETAYFDGPATMSNRASSGVMITATVLPLGCDQRLVWDISYDDPDNEWANMVQADAVDFVYIESGNDTNTVVYVNAYSAFGAPIKITATAVDNPNVSAYIIVDYMSRVEETQYMDVVPGGFFVDHPATSIPNYLNGIVLDGAQKMANMYGEPIELAAVEYGYGTITPEVLGVDYTLVISSEFRELLEFYGLESNFNGSHYIGNDVFTSAQLINLLAGEDIVPHNVNDTVDVSKIAAFNLAAGALGVNETAFSIMVEIETEYETKNVTFEFYFNPDNVSVYPMSIEFNMGNIIL